MRVSTDSQYLAALRAYYGKHNTLPSYAAIGRLVGLSSKGSVAEMVGRLKAAHFLDSAPDRRLRPGRRFYEREVSEYVRAGNPTLAVEGELENLNIDAYLVRDQRNTTMVRVKGDSMIDAGIREGDVVVVERRSNATIGQVVIANVEGEFTLKRLVRERGRYALRAENLGYAAVRLPGDFRIFGVVVGLIRSYR
jgi:SOS-response transcriptional repressor LexA